MRSITAGILVLLLALQTTGCGVGYMVTTNDLAEPGKVRQPLPPIKVACILYPTSSLRIAFDRVLRGRYEILDTLPSETNPTDSFAIFVDHEKRQDPSWQSMGWFFVSYLSFSVIPSVMTEHTRTTLTIIAPNGDRKSVEYLKTTKTYNWLPFSLFSPDYVFLIMPNGEKGYDEKELQLSERIADHFIREVTPFILAHGGG